MFSFSSKGLDKALRIVASLEKKLENPYPALEKCGALALTSVEQNFDNEGRPTPWKRSRRVLLHGGKTLTDTGVLRRSIKTKKISKNKIALFTRVKYAAIHNYGGPVQTKHGTYYMPKRKFLMLQSKDIPKMKIIINNYLKNK